MSELGFRTPLTGALALVSIVLLGVVLILAHRTKLANLRALGRTPGKRSLATELVPVALLILGALALSRPYWGREQIKVRQLGRDIMVVFDISRSMLTKDVMPTRLEQARRKVRGLANFIARSEPGDRIGIVLFSGASSLFCPLTSDLSTIDLFLDAIDTELITTPGSDLGGALLTASQALIRVGSKEGLILVISDGEDLEGSARDALNEVKATGARVSAIGVGTAEGQPIPLSDGRYLRDEKGEIVISRLNEKGLGDLARGGNGSYLPLSVDDSDIESIVRGISAVSRSENSASVTIYNELGPRVVWVMLGILGIGLLSRQALIFSLILALLAGPPSAIAQTSLRDAADSYARGDFESARKIFEAAHAADPQDFKTALGLGSTYFKLGDYEKAKQIFTALGPLAKNGRERYLASYDSGNVKLAMGDNKGAIKDFSEALSLKPGDEAAAHNLEVARKRLLQTPSPTPTPLASPTSAPTPSPNPSASPSAAPSPNPSPGTTPSPGASPEGAPSPPTGSPTSEAGTATPDPNGQKGSPTAEPTDPNQESEQEGDPTPTVSPGEETRSLEQREADAWLRSLPEAPLLLRQRRGTGAHKGQTW